MLMSLVYICDELLEEGVGKPLLYCWSVQLWRLLSSETEDSNSPACLFYFSQSYEVEHALTQQWHILKQNNI